MTNIKFRHTFQFYNSMTLNSAVMLAENPSHALPPIWPSQQDIVAYSSKYSSKDFFAFQASTGHPLCPYSLR